MKNKPRISRNSPANLVILIVVTLFIVVLQLVFPDMENLHQVDSVRVVNHWMHHVSVSEIWSVLGALPFILLNLFLIYHINSQFNIIPEAYYFPSWMYLLFSLSDYRLMHLSEDLIASSFTLLAIYWLFIIMHRRKAYTRMFWAGFFMACGSLMLPQLLLYLPLFFFALVLLNKINLRNASNFLLAIVAVYYILFAVLFIVGDINSMYQYQFFNNAFAGIQIPQFLPLLFDFVLAFICVVSLVYFFFNSGYLKVLTRSYLTIMIVFLLMGVFAYVFDACDNGIRYILAIPLSFLVSHYLLNTKAKYLPLTFTWILFIFFVLSQSLSVFNSLS